MTTPIGTDWTGQIERSCSYDYENNAVINKTQTVTRWRNVQNAIISPEQSLNFELIPPEDIEFYLGGHLWRGVDRGFGGVSKFIATGTDYSEEFNRNDIYRQEQVFRLFRFDTDAENNFKYFGEPEPPLGVQTDTGWIGSISTSMNVKQSGAQNTAVEVQAEIILTRRKDVKYLSTTEGNCGDIWGPEQLQFYMCHENYTMPTYGIELVGFDVADPYLCISESIAPLGSDPYTAQIVQRWIYLSAFQTMDLTA